MATLSLEPRRDRRPLAPTSRSSASRSATARVRLKAAQAALDAALRSGADARARRAAAGRGRRAAAAKAVPRSPTPRRGWSRSTKLSERLRGRRDPADLVQALDAAHPVMLLPVAVQTRYNDAATQLMIRIYPDAIHAFGHEPGLSDSEIDAGKRYWTQRFAVPADADSPWTADRALLSAAARRLDRARDDADQRRADRLGAERRAR